MPKITANPDEMITRVAMAYRTCTETINARSMYAFSLSISQTINRV